jgi:mono/diheme cytochrome c family protein
VPYLGLRCSAADFPGDIDMGRTIFFLLTGMFLAVGVALYFAKLAPVSGDLTLQPDNGNVVALGKRLYATHCAACHGRDLKGQPNWRTPDAQGYLPAPPHDATGHTWHHADALLLKITKLGTEKVVGGGYKSRMPAYKGVLSDNEILAVLSFIKSKWPKKIRQRHDRLNQATKGG